MSTFKKATSAGAAPTTPAGADSEIQFNDSGAFGANSLLNWNKTDHQLEIGTSPISAGADVYAVSAQADGMALKIIAGHTITELDFYDDTNAFIGLIGGDKTNGIMIEADIGDIHLTPTSAVKIPSTKKLILGNSDAAYLEYSTDHTTLLGNSSGTTLEISAIGNLSLYANTAADGTGTFTPGVLLLPNDISLQTHGSGTVQIQADGNSTTPDSAILQVVSTTQGFLPPKMTTTQRDAIASPVSGLMIYNTTTNKMNFFNGASWEAITSA